ncbi:phytanoyl-CoA dioxygenase family protein [Propionibacteriaceae bacterium Y2011]
MATLLTNEQIAAYRTKGYLVIRSALTEHEVAVLQQECVRLRETPHLVDPNNIRSGHRVIDGEQRIEKIDPCHDASPVLADLVADERILSPLRDIYLDEPKLFKDKLIFKLPGQPGYGMHQDAGWWQGFPYEQLTSVMVAIDGANAANGGLELFPGCHHELRSTPGVLQNMGPDAIAEIDESTGELVETRAGDLIFFNSLVPHRSGTNAADVSRTQLYLTYSPAAAGDLYRAHYQHYRRYAYGEKLTEPGNTYYFR